MKHIFMGLFFCVLLIFTESISFAYDNKKAHPLVNKTAGYESFLHLFLQEVLGYTNGIETTFFGETVEYWLEQGGIDEDDMPWFLYHFHDPLQNWLYAGLKIPIIPQSDSSVIYSQRNLAPYSWKKARTAYFNAISSGSEENYATVFLTLGHLMHLVSDLAVPAHVRNDPHPIDPEAQMFSWVPQLLWPNSWLSDPYEEWVKENIEEINLTGIEVQQSIFSHFVQTGSDYNSASIPITALWDQNRYTFDNPDPEVTKSFEPIFHTIGLAEYTNANFFSFDTIFSNVDYPHPSEDDVTTQIYWSNPEVIVAEDSKADYRPYIWGYAGGTRDIRLAAGSLISHDCMAINHKGVLVLDDQVHRDYASVLLPRAVGYSAALLDYFFRGRIDIQEPRLIIDSDSSILGISCSIKNITSPIETDQTVEPFSSGGIELVYSYSTEEVDSNGKTVEKKYYKNAGRVHLDTESKPELTINGASDTINYDYVDVAVDIPSTAIPAGAYGISFTLVFKGTLGDELEAVAAQMYSFDNSRIAYFHQPGGQPNTSNVFTISPDGSFPLQVTNATGPNPWFFSPTWSKDGTKMAFEDHSCTETDNDGFCPMDNYIRDIVIIDLLSEEVFPGNILNLLNNNGAPVTNPSFSPAGNKIAAVAMNTSGTLTQFSNIVVLDVLNGSATQLTQYDERVTDLFGSPSVWSPKGDEIALPSLPHLR